MILAMLARICARTGGVIDSAYVPPCPRKRNRSMRALDPEIYPPAAPKALVKVPISMSIDRGLTPK
jgi:hypothetical protein